MRISWMFAFGALLLQGAFAVDVSSGPVRRGEWNVDFPAVLDFAQREHCPLMLVYSSKGCPMCKKLNAALEGPAFKIWQKDRDVAMSYVRISDATPEVDRMAHDFIKGVDSEVSGYPFVCVSWLKMDGTTNAVAFSGRRSKIGEKRNRLLSVALMTELDKVLKDYVAARPESKTIDQILADSTRKISFKTEGAPGSVVMHPDTGVLTEGGNVSLEASPTGETLFVGWFGPDGEVVGYKRRIAVSGSMSAGEYTARFRPKAGCPPPDVKPAETSFCVTAGMPFSYTIPIGAECRPVRFKTKRMKTAGLKFDDDLGRLYGTPKHPGVYAVDITVIGSDSGHTAVKHTVSIDVKPRR